MYNFEYEKLKFELELTKKENLYMKYVNRI